MTEFNLSRFLPRDLASVVDQFVVILLYKEIVTNILVNNIM